MTVEMASWVVFTPWELDGQSAAPCRYIGRYKRAVIRHARLYIEHGSCSINKSWTRQSCTRSPSSIREWWSGGTAGGGADSSTELGAALHGQALGGGPDAQRRAANSAVAACGRRHRGPPAGPLSSRAWVASSSGPE